MNRHSADLEADLINGRSARPFSMDDQAPASGDYLIQEERPAPGISDISSFSDTIRYNFISILLYSVKIIASIWALVSSFYSMDYSCISISQVWILLVLWLDAMNLNLANMRMKNKLILDRIVEHRNRQFAEQAATRRNNPESENGGNSIPIENNDAIAGDTTEMMFRSVKITMLNRISLIVWIMLFISGLIIKASEVAPTCPTTQTRSLLGIYVTLSIVWLCTPIFLVVLGCFCLPILMFVIWLFGGPKPASQSVIRKLPVKTYTSDLCGEKECVICMVEYEEGDKIVQLDCSSLHYFHEECLKKWLKINGQCPVCRSEIGKKKSEPAPANLSAGQH